MRLSTLQVEFAGRPSTLAYMARALYPSPGLKRAGGFPPVRARWRQHRVDRRQLAAFLRLTGLPADGTLPLLYPHVFGFPLLMVVLTLRAWPLPLWGALQVRNHLLQHRPIPEDALLDLETRVAGQRVLEKGAEVDLHTTVCSGGAPLWESLVTFYYRGRFGEAGAASPLAQAPEIGGAEIARWRTGSGTGALLARLTGDHNGIHRWHWYARLFGFRRAFHHPQLVLGQCMARLPAPGGAGPQRLDAWLRGPVYYDAPVRLRGTADRDAAAFALTVDEEARPAMLGRLRAGDGRLVDEGAGPVPGDQDTGPAQGGAGPGR